MNALACPPIFDPNNVASRDPLPASTSSPVLLRDHHEALAIPNALVVSGDNAIVGSLCETMLLCGAVPVSIATIEQASRHVAADNIRFGVCQDRLPDGKYEDLVLLNHAVGISFPWIVVSRTGDWPEYLAAVELGAYDFLPYPLMHGELSRILRTLLETATATEYNRPLFPTHGCPAPSRTNVDLEQCSKWRPSPYWLLSLSRLEQLRR
jgi:DNA-binding response OmpR family regulator